VDGNELDNGREEQRGAARIGTLLRSKRREKGLSLQDVEQATKIRARYLDGLEREDYSALPAAVYIHGFLKTYANFLGLDGERLSRELKEYRSPRRERQPEHEGEGPEPSEFEQPLVAPGALGSAERRRISGTIFLTVALAVVVLAVVTGILYFVGRGSQEAAVGPTGDAAVEPDPNPSLEKPAKEPSTNPTETTVAGTAGGRTDYDPADNATGMIQATVRVLEDPSYLSIRTDGTTVYQQPTQPGFSQTYEARDVIGVTAGNAGAVRVEINGQDAGPIGSYGEVATRTFDRRPGVSR
jgi:cytoskeleton protein RodZ